MSADTKAWLASDDVNAKGRLHAFMRYDGGTWDFAADDDGSELSRADGALVNLGMRDLLELKALVDYALERSEIRLTKKR